MSTTATTATLKSDLRYINPFVQTGITETLTQASDGLFAASNGAFRLESAYTPGVFETASFWNNIAGLITRRDPTSLSPIPDTKLVQSDYAHVKINRKIGPVAVTRDAFRKAGLSRNAADLVIGEQAGKAMQVDMVNTAIRSLRAAMSTDTATYVDGAAGGPNVVGANGMVDAIARFGDAANAIVVWVMHSTTFFKLIKDQATANIGGVSGLIMAGASPATLGRPVIITDSPDLVVPNGITTAVGPPAVTVDAYYTLGLTAGAASMKESEGTEVVTQDVTGQENLIVRVQGEYAQNIGLKGYSWDTINGGENPTNAALGTGTNWDVSYGDVKDRAGVVIRTR